MIATDVVVPRLSVPACVTVSTAIAGGDIVRLCLRLDPLLDFLDGKIPGCAFWDLLGIQESSPLTSCAIHLTPP